MTRCACISKACTYTPEHTVRMAGNVVALCPPCLAFAENVGLAPTPVPVWLARSLEGRGLAKDLSRNVA